jgi:hypothetical protein
VSDLDVVNEYYESLAAKFRARKKVEELPESTVNPEDKEPIDYAGWGPCFHAVEQGKQLEEEIKEFLGAPWGVESLSGYGGMLERLLWEINQLGGMPYCLADQWVAIHTTGRIFLAENHAPDAEEDFLSPEITTYIESDSFLGAAFETLRWWRVKRDELRAKHAKEKGDGKADGV